MNSISIQIQMILLQKNMKQSDLAEKLGMTQQNISLKFKKDDYKLSELIKIATILDSKVTITATDNNSNISKDITSSLIDKNYRTSEIQYISMVLGFQIHIKLEPLIK